ncbi:hypothetical protein [Hymenobacter volaticus]|uniref:YubB ferredoxin-like domain-containing protein n=1 Tax=Hymenobacter volaticus TaxID=2932254 RepID=A0ABY4GBA8_9BACT|nr:hypothetical protein [Hymenobacter volaticus]UOQ68060.1 hypothetical protein MUN86_09515 [Hymenobacter volaticus]
MEDFYVSEMLSTGQIQECLQAAMPSLTVFEWAMLVGDQEPMEFDSTNPKHIFFEADAAEVPQFPQHICIYRTPNEHWEARALWLGQKLSATYQVDVLVPFTHPEKPDYPYYDIVFQNGSSYLADDSETEFGEPAAKPVCLLESYSLPRAKFDTFGNYIIV